MKHCLEFKRILLVLLATACATEGTLFPQKFKKLESEKTITGKLSAKVMSRSKLQCSDKCSADVRCVAYQYKRTSKGNCLLVHRNSTQEDGQIYENDKTVVYEKVSNEESSNLATVSTVLDSECQTTATILDFGETWEPLSGWTGPNPALYRSFDVLDGLVLMEGTEQVDSTTLVPGKLNLALSLDRTRHQWVDLGIHTEACMTRPETCGVVGGAISLWINVVECPNSFTTIVGSVNADAITGSAILCGFNRIRGNIFLPDGLFFMDHDIETGWKHILLNYIGPDDGQGAKLFLDGSLVQSDSSKEEGSRMAGDGRIIVGNGGSYENMDIDELIFFNQALGYGQIELLHNGI